MKKLLLVLLISNSVFAQKNVLKFNLSSLLLHNYSVSYERSLSKHTSFLLNGRYMPNETIPYAVKLQSFVTDPGVDVGKFKLGNYAITAELRYYFGKKPQNGFYVAPYVRKNNFEISAPIFIDIQDPVTKISTSNNAQFTGSLSSISGGVLFGIQKQLSKVFVFDLWLIGAHAGYMQGNVLATLSPPINTILQAELSKQIEQAKKDSPIPFDYMVSQDKVNFSTNSLVAGIRGLGFNLGIKF